MLKLVLNAAYHLDSWHGKFVAARSIRLTLQRLGYTREVRASQPNERPPTGVS